MWITRRTDYATRAVLALALARRRPASQDPRASPPLRARRCLSSSSSCPSCGAAGIVRSERGPERRVPAQPRAGRASRWARVVRAVQGPLAPISCATRHEPEPCPMEVGCTLRETWAEVRDATIADPRRKTFADLAARSGGRCGRGQGVQPGLTGIPAARHAWNPPTRSVARRRPRSWSVAAARLERVALVAHQDHHLVRVARLGDPVRAAGVEPPLEHVAVDDHGAGHLAVTLPLLAAGGCRRAARPSRRGTPPPVGPNTARAAGGPRARRSSRSDATAVTVRSESGDRQEGGVRWRRHGQGPPRRSSWSERSTSRYPERVDDRPSPPRAAAHVRREGAVRPRRRPRDASASSAASTTPTTGPTGSRCRTPPRRWRCCSS